MSESSTTGYKVVIGLLAAALIIVSVVAFTKKGGSDDEVAGALKKVQASLDDCQTQRSDLKDKVARLENDLKRAQEQASNVVCAPGQPITASHTPVGDGKLGLTVDQIKKVTAQTGGLKMCYDRALKRDSSLEHAGMIHVTFQFNIHPSGNVGETAVKSDTHIDQTLVDCFKGAVARWKFPSFEGQPIPVDMPQPFQPESRK